MGESAATGEDESVLGFGHSQNVLELNEVVEFGFVFRGKIALSLEFHQLRDAMLRLRRRTIIDHRFRVWYLRRRSR